MQSVSGYENNIRTRTYLCDILLISEVFTLGRFTFIAKNNDGLDNVSRPSR